MLIVTIGLVGSYFLINRGGQPSVVNASPISKTSSQYDIFLKQIGNSLVSLHSNSSGGWRFKSEIQAPHYQTDRDVGAASVGMGFLAMADTYPKDKQWVSAAKHTADWLMAVSKQDNNGGRYWPDYVDNNEVSSDLYSSFDDGTIGIGDYFWRLYEKTGDIKYKKVSLESLQWTFSQAELYTQSAQQAYRWKWDITDKQSPYFMGMGEGTVGIVNTLATYYQRLYRSDPLMAAECKKYMLGGLNYIDIVRGNLADNIGSDRALPETAVIGQDGDTGLNSGYLSGAAGAAFMYLNLHQIFGDENYLDKSKVLLDWLSDPVGGPLVKVEPDQFAWRLELDPQGGDNNQYATGVEEGNAGIGWSYLQAYGQTGNKQYLDTAEAAANWLLDVAIKDQNGGLYWHEDEHPASNSTPHVNLNNGVAGIGMYLQDLYLTTGDNKYHDGAAGALKWIMNSAQHQGKNIFWIDNSDGTFQNDPSWHWGDAGIIEFVQRMNRVNPKNAFQDDIIGEQSSLPSKFLYNK